MHISNQARLSVEQLKREPRAGRDVIQRVREVQRSLRELFGLYFYIKMVAHRVMLFTEPVATHPLAFQGVFVDDGALAEELQRAWVPFWFICPNHSVLGDTRIYRAVHPLLWDSVLARNSWRSRLDGRELFMAMSPSANCPVSLRSSRNSLLTEARMISIISNMRHAMGRDQGLNRAPLQVGNSLK